MHEQFSIPIRVYIEDTDAGRIVYYVNYLKYLERARTEFMRTLGYDRPAVPDSDAMFVVTEVALKYLKPAVLDDLLHATLCIRQARGATIEFYQTLLRRDEILLEGTVRIALVSRSDGRPKRLALTLRKQLARKIGR